MTLKPEQTVLPLVDEQLQRSTLSGVAFQPPEIVADIDQVMQDLRAEPVYWRLPEQFEGRKVNVEFHYMLTCVYMYLYVAMPFFSLPVCCHTVEGASKENTCHSIIKNDLLPYHGNS